MAFENPETETQDLQDQSEDQEIVGSTLSNQAYQKLAYLFCLPTNRNLFQVEYIQEKTVQDQSPLHLPDNQYPNQYHKDSIPVEK